MTHLGTIEMLGASVMLGVILVVGYQDYFACVANLCWYIEIA